MELLLPLSQLNRFKDGNEFEDDINRLLCEATEVRSMTILKENFEIRIQQTESEASMAENELKKAKAREAEIAVRVEELTSSLHEKLKAKEDIARYIEELRYRIENLKTNNVINLKSNCIEERKNLLNAYKRILKVKWFFNDSITEIDGVIFNEITGRMKEISVTPDKISESTIQEMWNDLGLVCGGVKL